MSRVRVAQERDRQACGWWWWWRVKPVIRWDAEVGVWTTWLCGLIGSVGCSPRRAIRRRSCQSLIYHRCLIGEYINCRLWHRHGLLGPPGNLISGHFFAAYRKIYPSAWVWVHLHHHSLFQQPAAEARCRLWTLRRVSVSVTPRCDVCSPSISINRLCVPLLTVTAVRRWGSTKVLRGNVKATKETSLWLLRTKIKHAEWHLRFYSPHILNKITKKTVSKWSLFGLSILIILITVLYFSFSSVFCFIVVFCAPVRSSFTFWDNSILIITPLKWSTEVNKVYYWCVTVLCTCNAGILLCRSY